MSKELKRNVYNLFRLLAKRSPVAPLLLRWFRSVPHQKALRLGREHGWDQAASWILEGDGQSILRDPAFHERLRGDINYDLDTELLLVSLRKMLFLSKPHVFQEEMVTTILVTLLVQVHNNEFIWRVTQEERNFIVVCADRIERRDWSEERNGPLPLLLLLYQRMGSSGIDFESQKSAISDLQCLSSDQKHVISELAEEVAELQSFSRAIESHGEAKDEISEKIASLYETFPYPRWLSWGMRTPGSRVEFLRQFYARDELEFATKPFTVLVAGCGTGSKAIAYGVEYGENVQVIAIDLSRPSLAYAQRMADKYEVTNVKFIQMDLRNLGDWSQRFDIVEATGVLHHLPDPVEGGRAFVESAKIHGLIHVSLYSTSARRSLAYLRDKYDLTPQHTPDDIRNVRMKMIENDSEYIDKKLSLRDNFFDLNQCKDLLFHPLERTYTLPDVEELLDELDLDFRGIQRPDIVRSQYWTKFPKMRDASKMDVWKDFETRHPMAFGGLYEIWAKKKSTTA